MIAALQRKSRCVGSALFRGSIPPEPDELGALERVGVSVRATPVAPDAHWQLELAHPDQGKARVTALKDAPLPLAELVELDAKLSAEDVSDIRSCGSLVTVAVDGTRNNVLQDRKRLLFYLRHVIGELGVAAMDQTSQQFWSRQALDDELCHDADLDIDALFVIHAVYDEEPRHPAEPPTAEWLHTHGLGEIGLHDFDLLQLHRTHLSNLSDLTRALAYAIAEGHIGPHTRSFPLAHPGGDVGLVEAERFMTEAPRPETALRDDPTGSHRERRVVVCDPLAAGFLARLFRRSNAVRASRFLQQRAPEHGMMAFSSTTTELVAERARRTLGVFEALLDEFEDLELPKLVKIGYPVDGDTSGEREHLWFEAHGISGDRIDATLINEPFRIARMSTGDRDRHDLALVTDWQILSPTGSITPRFVGAARLVRARRSEIEAMLSR